MEIKQNLSLDDAINELVTDLNGFKKHYETRFEDLEKKHLDLNKIVEMQYLAENRPVISQIDQTDSFDKSFIHYLKTGDSTNLEKLNIERKSMHGLSYKSDSTTSSGGSAGVLVSPHMTSKIIDTLEVMSPIRQAAKITKVSGESNEYLQCLEEIQDSSWVAEEEMRPITNGVGYKKISIKLYEMYANCPVSAIILNDSIINLETFLLKKITRSFTTLENKAFLFGSYANNSKSPSGIITYNDAATNTNKISEIIVDSLGKIGYDTLVSLMLSLDPSYLSGACWMMSAKTLQALRTLTDPVTKTYLWQPSFNSGIPNSLMGYPIRIVNEMALDQASEVPIIFGNLSEGYLILDCNGVSMLRDPYSIKPYILFYVTKRVGGAVVNPDAIKMIRIKKI